MPIDPSIFDAPDHSEFVVADADITDEMVADAARQMGVRAPGGAGGGDGERAPEGAVPPAASVPDDESFERLAIEMGRQGVAIEDQIETLTRRAGDEARRSGLGGGTEAIERVLSEILDEVRAVRDELAAGRVIGGGDG